MKIRLAVVLAAVVLTVFTSYQVQAQISPYRYMAGDHYLIEFMTEDEVDSMITDPQKRMMTIMQRSMLAKEIADSLSLAEVMLVTVIVTNYDNSPGTITLDQTRELGIQRGDTEIQSHGIAKNIGIVVYPGELGIVLIVFDRFPILPTDSFYIKRK